VLAIFRRQSVYSGTKAGTEYSLACEA
jgi:hypothetical protein